MPVNTGTKFVEVMAVLSKFADAARRLPVYPTVEQMIAAEHLLNDCTEFVSAHENEVVDLSEVDPGGAMKAACTECGYLDTADYVQPSAQIIAFSWLQSRRRLKELQR